jgi:hypothetical protein
VQGAVGVFHFHVEPITLQVNEGLPHKLSCCTAFTYSGLRKEEYRRLQRS